MRELEITSLYDTMEASKAEDFTSKIESEMRVKTDYYKDVNDTEWLDVFERILPHLEKIFRNPKRFIVTEEEIVKIEQAKKVGVETVKHLAKHTNFIQDIDQGTGDVLPSKLLNVLKEETFATYENRFVFTLVLHMKDFVRKRKEMIKKNPKLRDNKKMEYSSSTKVGEEKVNININLDTALDTDLSFDKKFEQRLKKIEDNIKDLQYTEVFRILEKEKVALVTPPIKKTNVILKNVNFQYAMELWDYVHQNMTKKNEPIKKNRDYYEKGKIRTLIDESFLLDYLTLSTINEDEPITKEKKEKALSKMLDRIIDMNPELTKKQLQDKMGIQFDKAKERRAATKGDIEKIFRKYIDKYLGKDKDKK